jgi:hypothetical protein
MMSRNDSLERGLGEQVARLVELREQLRDGTGAELAVVVGPRHCRETLGPSVTVTTGATHDGRSE